MTLDGTLVASGVNTIVAMGLEETAFGTAAAAEMWTGMVDEFVVAREDNVYLHRGMTNNRNLKAHATIGSRYPVSIRGKIDSGVPFAQIGGYISGASDPTVSIFRGASHPTPTKSYLPSWTVKRTFDDDSVNLNVLGTTFSSGTFSCDLDGPWTYDLQGVGKATATVAATGVAIPSNLLGSWNTTLNIDENAVDFTTADDDILGLKNISFTVANNNLVRNEFGASAPVAIRQPKGGPADITLNLTRGYIDDDLWAAIADGGTNSFELVISDGATVLTHEFDDCRSTNFEISTNLDDESLETVSLVVRDWNCVVTDTVTYVSYD